MFSEGVGLGAHMEQIRERKNGAAAGSDWLRSDLKKKKKDLPALEKKDGQNVL